jgi:hypothetical protein
MIDHPEHGLNGKLLFRSLIGAVFVGMISWMSWVTFNVANYVTGEKRGERLSTTEAELMLEKMAAKLRREWDDRLEKERLTPYKRVP